MIEFIDLFAGLGGIRIGFTQAAKELGLETRCVFTSEIKDAALKALNHNFPNSNFKVIIANPFAVAESISLHKACHNAIYLERSFNCAHFVQSKDRIHRYGLSSDAVTNYYYLLSQDTLDSVINDRLHDKESRMIAIIESAPIPLFSNLGDDGNEDIKAIIRDYVKRKNRKI